MTCNWKERTQANGYQSSGVPVVKTSDDSTGQKRARDDEANGDHPAKKVDSKE